MYSEFKKSITKTFTILVNVKWECPYCGEENETEYHGSPYRAIAYDPADEMCDSCKDFVTLNFYENEDQ